MSDDENSSVKKTRYRMKKRKEKKEILGTPKTVDFFRLKNKKTVIYEDVASGRKLNEELWKNMINGEPFPFGEEHGYRLIADEDSSGFPMCEYLLSKEGGLSLQEILGPDVRIVTHLNLLKDILFIAFGGNKIWYTCELQYERLGNVIFVNHRKIPNSCQRKGSTLLPGEEEPASICSPSLGEEDLDEVGKAYSVQSFAYGDSSILYSCPVHNFTPDGQPVNLTIDRHNKCINGRKKLHNLKRGTDGYEYHMLFEIKNGTDQTYIRRCLTTMVSATMNSMGHRKMRNALEFLFDNSVHEFLRTKTRCIFKVGGNPEIQPIVEETSPDYESFLSQEFRNRFADDSPYTWVRPPKVNKIKEPTIKEVTCLLKTFVEYVPEDEMEIPIPESTSRLKEWLVNNTFSNLDRDPPKTDHLKYAIKIPSARIQTRTDGTKMKFKRSNLMVYYRKFGINVNKQIAGDKTILIIEGKPTNVHLCSIELFGYLQKTMPHSQYLSPKLADMIAHKWDKPMRIAFMRKTLTDLWVTEENGLDVVIINAWTLEDVGNAIKFLDEIENDVSGKSGKKRRRQGKRCRGGKRRSKKNQAV